MITWLPIKGYKKLYQVSSNGEVRRMQSTINYRIKGKTRIWKGRVLKNKLDKKNYYNVCLSKEGVKSFPRVHLLVLETFKCKRPKGLQAAHLDGNSKNNNIKNLDWVTASVNNGEHKRKHGTASVGDKNGNSKRSRELRKLIINK